MSRFLFPISALLLAVSFVVLFGASSAYASSPYDNVFSVADNLTLNHMQAGEPSRDYSLDWSSEAVAATQAKCDRIGGQSCQDAIDLNNLTGLTENDDNDYAVFADPSHNFYTIVYTTTPNTGTTSWIQSNGDYYLEFGSTAYNSIRSINIYYWPEGYDHSENGSYAGISSAYGISVNGGYPVFLSTFPITYPDGYEGDIIPDTYNPPGQTDPLIDWWLTEKLVFSARYLNNLGIDNTAWTWKIFPADDNFQITGDPIYTSDEIQGINMFTYTFAEKGKYIARASFRVPAPGLPPPSEVRTSIDIQLNVNGYYQHGGTNHCQDGICNNMEDTPGNYFLGIKIPDHGLSAVITVPLEFISNLSNSNCSPITLPFPVGRDITLQCLQPFYQQHAATLFALWQTVITGAVAYLVAVNIFAKIKGISNPKDDSIEVYKL